MKSEKEIRDTLSSFENSTGIVIREWSNALEWVLSEGYPSIKSRLVVAIMSEIRDNSLFTDDSVIEIDIGCLESIIEKHINVTK